VIFHAPLALIGLLLAASLVIEAPRGGLSVAPLGIAERAADGVVWSDRGAGPAVMVELAFAR
jgi:hypothetical protein